MRRELSSGMTRFYKFVAPVLQLCGVGVFAYVLLVRVPAPNLFKWPILGGAVIFCVVWWRWLSSLRRVILENDWFLISDYFCEIRVPVSTLANVTEQRGRERRVILEFRVETEFGMKVAFLPRMEMGVWPWQEHPIMPELRSLIAATQQTSQATHPPPLPLSLFRHGIPKGK